MYLSPIFLISLKKINSIILLDLNKRSIFALQIMIIIKIIMGDNVFLQLEGNANDLLAINNDNSMR